MDRKQINWVPMFGPCLKDPSKTVNRAVAENDVLAYIAAGYEKGSIDVEPEVTVAEMVEVKPKAKKK